MRIYFSTSEEELGEFNTKARTRNSIRQFWKRILHNMPAELYLEARRKRTDLIRQEKDNFRRQDGTPYQFQTREASAELAEYLSKFVIFVVEEYI